MPPSHDGPGTADEHPLAGTWSAATYGEAFADVYDDWYGTVSDVEGTVAAVAALGGPVLELGVGTGRIALALAAAGLEVTGVDASEAMLDRLRAKPGGSAVTVHVCDITRTLPPGPFATVLVAWNTLFNLAGPGEQQRAIELVATVLGPGGHFVVEAAVPADAEPDDRVRVRSIAPDRLVLSASLLDPDTGVTSGQFVEISASGIVLRPWRIRLIGPSALDELCRTAGLELVSRSSGWDHEPFDERSTGHVSVYRRAPTEVARPAAGSVGGQ